MTSLVHFQDLKGQANATNVSERTQEVAVPPMIAQLRRRLLNGAGADSLDVKIAILGELVYLSYIDVMKRRYL